MHVLKEIQPGTSQVSHDVNDVTYKKGCDSAREYSRPLEHRPELELSTRAAKRLCTGFKGKLNDLFEGDKSLKDVEWSLSYELTRSVDGGTDKTRISELASLVKALRKAVRAYQQKVKELHQFVASEEIRVSESSNTVDLNDPDEPSPPAAGQKGSEEERLALEKTISTLTMQIKQLQVEVVTLEGRLKDMGIKNNLKVAAVEEEAMRLKRDLLEERCKATQLQASEKASKAAAERAESELASLREGTAKQLSDANANKGELWKQMMHHKDQADKERKGLFDQLTDAQSALEAIQLKYETERGRASMLEDDKVKLKKQLEKAELEVEACEAKLLAYSKDLVRIQEQEEVAKKQADSVATELADALTAAAKAKADKEEVGIRAASWESKFQTAESARVSAEQQVARYKQELELLAKDAEGLKEALVVATTERDGLDTSLAEALKELEESAGKRSEVEAAVEAERATMREENETLRAEKEELGAKLSAQSHATTAAEEKALALEAQMEALQDVVGAGDQKQMVGQLITRVGHLETALWEAEKSRRRNHNELMEVKGNIRVFCRLRPSSGAAAVDPLHGDGVRCLVEGKAHDFYFDRVLPPTTTQETVFYGVSDVIQSALDGYHVCLFSYGQTGSGKTYTMNGNSGAPGIIPRAVSMLLEASERLGSVGWNFRLEATFIEVYNDVLRDLLAPVKAGAVGSAGARVLDSAAIKHDPKSHTQVIGATKILVDSEAQARDLLARAQKARSTDATAMNAESSRSHSVFTLCITGEHEEKGFKLLGSLNLVDLAGSERLARSQAEGQRQKETCAINKSLACLGDIFQALATKSGHIPYRNSKLTYLLQPCLGGDGKTLMFININPEAPSAYESLCALRFASKVNTVETGARGGAKRNVVASSTASPAEHGAVPGGPGAGGPGALPPLHRGSSDGNLGNRTGLPRPSTGGPATTGIGRQSILGRRDSIASSHSRTSSSGKGSGARSSLAPQMGGRSSSVPVYKRQR